MPHRARPFLRPLVSLPGKVALSGRSSWSVLAQPRSLAVALTSLVARLPKGMVPLAIVLDVGQAKGTYLAAGVVLAALGAGDAAATPLQGWLVDRFGRGRVLLPSAAMYALALAGLVGATAHGEPTGLLAGCAFLAGIGFPPVSGASRLSGRRWWPGSACRCPRSRGAADGGVDLRRPARRRAGRCGG